MKEYELKEIDEVTARLLDDYGDTRVIDQLDVFQLPNREEIENIVDKLFRIVYPGYYRERSYKIYNIKHIISTLIEDVVYNLQKQIVIALKYLPEYNCCEDDSCTKKAHEITLAFVRSIPKVRALLELDIQAFFEGDPAAENKDEIICSYPGIRAVTTYRLAHELLLLGVPVIPRTMTEYAHEKTGIDIHPGAKIGKYFFIDHGTGIVIGETTVIGCHVKIYQGVTLGGLSTRGGQNLKGKKRHPTIQDNVTIYSGSSILGGDTVIGHDVVIGGNAFITKSVPANTKITVRNQELILNENRNSKENALSGDCSPE